jgi:acetyl esterase/lipase
MTDQLPEGAAQVIDLWPDGAPGTFRNDRPEAIFANPDPSVPERWIRNVTRARLTVFPAQGARRGRSVLVVPGGAFHFVSIDNEGYDVARALAARGMDAFVLTYRVWPMPAEDADIPAFMLELGQRLETPVPGQSAPPGGSDEVAGGRALACADGQQAMRVLRARAADLGIDPARIGVMGFSAGGGVAVDLALAAPADCRPAFAVPVYPAWAPAPVPPDCPPMCLVTAADDPLVAPFSTAALAQMCHAAGVPVACHIYGNGGHGFGIRRQGNLSDRWFSDVMDWLDVFARGAQE